MESKRLIRAREWKMISIYICRIHVTGQSPIKQKIQYTGSINADNSQEQWLTPVILAPAK